jgi:hypothetical protein
MRNQRENGEILGRNHADSHGSVYFSFQHSRWSCGDAAGLILTVTTLQ